MRQLATRFPGKERGGGEGWTEFERRTFWLRAGSESARTLDARQHAALAAAPPAAAHMRTFLVAVTRLPKNRASMMQRSASGRCLNEESEASARRASQLGLTAIK